MAAETHLMTVFSLCVVTSQCDTVNCGGGWAGRSVSWACDRSCHFGTKC